MEYCAKCWYKTAHTKTKKMVNINEFSPIICPFVYILLPLGESRVLKEAITAGNEAQGTGKLETGV